MAEGAVLIGKYAVKPPEADVVVLTAVKGALAEMVIGVFTSKPIPTIVMAEAGPGGRVAEQVVVDVQVPFVTSMYAPVACAPGWRPGIKAAHRANKSKTGKTCRIRE